MTQAEPLYRTAASEAGPSGTGQMGSTLTDGAAFGSTAEAAPPALPLARLAAKNLPEVPVSGQQLCEHWAPDGSSARKPGLLPCAA